MAGDGSWLNGFLEEPKAPKSKEELTPSEHLLDILTKNLDHNGLTHVLMGSIIALYFPEATLELIKTGVAGAAAMAIATDTSAIDLESAITSLENAYRPRERTSEEVEAYASNRV